MKVLHVTLSMYPGGRREAILTLSAGLARRGIECYLCCLDALELDPKGEPPAVFRDSLVLQRSGILDFGALNRLRKFSIRHGIDVLHAHDAASELTCALAMPEPRRPMLMSFHRTRSFESERPRDRFRNAVAGWRAGAIATASTERRKHYLSHNHVPERKVVRIPLGVDLERFRPPDGNRNDMRKELGIEPDCLLVGVMGHFGPEKGVDLAVQAFQAACRAQPDIKAEMLILGTGAPDRVAMIKSLIEPGFAERIHLAGFRPNPQQLLACFDVLLHGARGEAFGLVLIEAMASRVPVIAPAVGGIADIVEHEVSGLLVDRADSELLATALARILTDDGLRQRLADGALARARTEFGSDLYAARFEQLYRDLLAGRAPAVEPQPATPES